VVPAAAHVLRPGRDRAGYATMIALSTGFRSAPATVARKTMAIGRCPFVGVAARRRATALREIALALSSPRARTALGFLAIWSSAKA
jgi:hypothetical protein